MKSELNQFEVWIESKHKQCSAIFSIQTNLTLKRIDNSNKYSVRRLAKTINDKPHEPELKEVFRYYIESNYSQIIKTDINKLKLRSNVTSPRCVFNTI